MQTNTLSYCVTVKGTLSLGFVHVFSMLDCIQYAFALSISQLFQFLCIVHVIHIDYRYLSFKLQLCMENKTLHKKLLVENCFLELGQLNRFKLAQILFLSKEKTI